MFEIEIGPGRFIAMTPDGKAMRGRDLTPEDRAMIAARRADVLSWFGPLLFAKYRGPGYPGSAMWCWAELVFQADPARKSALWEIEHAIVLGEMGKAKLLIDSLAGLVSGRKLVDLIGEVFSVDTLASKIGGMMNFDDL